MALNPNALVTWDFIKSLKNTFDDAEDLVIGEFLINSISQRVEHLTKRFLPAADYTLTLAGTGRKEIILPNYPVNSITNLYIDSSRAFGAETEIAAADYELEAKTGIIYLYNQTAPKERGVVKVVFNAGYATIPEDLQQAVFETFMWNIGRIRGQGIGIESQSAGGVSVKQALTIPSSAWTVFLDYRRADF